MTKKHTGSVSCNEFVKRQTKESPYSHTEYSWDELAVIAHDNLDKAKPGYREGVILVPLPVDQQGRPMFFTGVINLRAFSREYIEGKLHAVFETRRSEEAPYVQVRCQGVSKQPATHACAVLYSHETLGDDASSTTNWEIVSLNVGWDENEPLTPMAMARNFLELPGGTKAEYTAEEFAKAIIYWSDKVMTGA